MNRCAIALAALLAAQAAAAQTVWRCSTDGRVGYADTPCPGGQAVAAADGRSAQERASAAQVLARDRALAERLRDERLAAQRERRELLASASTQAGSLGGAAPPAAPAAPTKKPKAPKPPKKGKQPPSVLQPAAAGTSPSAAPSTRLRSG